MNDRDQAAWDATDPTEPLPCASCEHWRLRALANQSRIAAETDTRLELARWRQQCMDLQAHDDIGAAVTHLYLARAAEAERRLDEMGTRLALAERALRRLAAGQPARTELAAWTDYVKEQESA